MAAAIKSPHFCSMSLGCHSARRLSFPLSKHRGDSLTLTGELWLETTAATRIAEQKLRVLEIDEKIYTSNVPFVEGHNFWRVSQKNEASWFSNADKAKVAAAAAAAAAATFTTAAAAARLMRQPERRKQLRT